MPLEKGPPALLNIKNEIKYAIIQNWYQLYDQKRFDPEWKHFYDYRCKIIPRRPKIREDSIETQSRL